MVEERGGSADLEAFATSPAERRALWPTTSSGVRRTSSETYFHHPSSNAELEAAISVQVIAGLFEGGDGARSSLDRYGGPVHPAGARRRDRALGRPRRRSAWRDGARRHDGIAYLWRMGNLVLVVVGSGPIRDAVVLGLARTVDARTHDAATPATDV